MSSNRWLSGPLGNTEFNLNVSGQVVSLNYILPTDPDFSLWLISYFYYQNKEFWANFLYMY